MMGYGGADLTAAGCRWPVIGPLRGACVQAVGGGLSGLAAQFSDESALEVCTVYMLCAIQVDVFTLLFLLLRQRFSL